MLKHFLTVAIAFIVTLFALLIFWFVFMPWFHFPMLNEKWPKLALAILGLTAAIYLFGRSRSWLALLLLVGFIPVLLVNISYVGWNWRMTRYYSKSPPGDDPWLASLFPGDNEYSPVNTLLSYSIYLCAVCLMIAFFAYFFRIAERYLTKRWAKNSKSN